MELTVETLTPENRDKRIGKSLYRIVRDYDVPPYSWGILEIYDCWTAWSFACWSTNLSAVLKVYNRISEERALTGELDTPLNQRKYPQNLKEGTP